MFKYVSLLGHEKRSAKLLRCCFSPQRYGVLLHQLFFILLFAQLASVTWEVVADDNRIRASQFCIEFFFHYTYKAAN